MKIVVLMKQVPNKDAILRVRVDGKWVEEGDLSFEVNESDGYALEEALRLREKKGGGEVVVVTLGPQRAKSVIKDATGRRESSSPSSWGCRTPPSSSTWTTRASSCV